MRKAFTMIELLISIAIISAIIAAVTFSWTYSVGKMNRESVLKSAEEGIKQFLSSVRGKSIRNHEAVFFESITADGSTTLVHDASDPKKNITYTMPVNVFLDPSKLSYCYILGIFATETSTKYLPVDEATLIISVLFHLVWVIR